MKNDIIPITEYAKLQGKALVTVRQKCARGGFETAIKPGRDWYISKREPYIDHRKKGQGL